MSEPIKVEPSALQRQAAKEVHGMFIALVDEGFSEWQALTVIGQIIAGSPK